MGGYDGQPSRGRQAGASPPARHEDPCGGCPETGRRHPLTAYQIDEGGNGDKTDAGAQQRDTLRAVGFQGAVQPDGIETFTACTNQIQMCHGSHQSADEQQHCILVADRLVRIERRHARHCEHGSRQVNQVDTGLLQQLLVFIDPDLDVEDRLEKDDCRYEQPMVYERIKGDHTHQCERLGDQGIGQV